MTPKRALLVSCLLASCWITGCAGADPGPASTQASQTEGTRPDETGATRASRELVAREERSVSATAPPPATPSLPPAARPLLTVSLVEVAQAEDGRGATVAAPRAIAFDIDARRFPARALDPVLHVGALEFRDYEHPAPGVLRFVAADVGQLREGAPVSAEFEGEPQSRVVLSEALELP